MHAIATIGGVAIVHAVHAVHAVTRASGEAVTSAREIEAASNDLYLTTTTCTTSRHAATEVIGTR